MSKTRIRSMVWVADGDNITDGKAIKLNLITHLLDEAEWSVGILNDATQKLSLAEAQELVESLTKAIAELKTKEQRKFEQAVERVNAL